VAVLEDSDAHSRNRRSDLDAADFSHLVIDVSVSVGGFRFIAAFLQCCQDGTLQNVQTWATLKMQKLAFGQLECGCWLVEFVSQHW